MKRRVVITGNPGVGKHTCARIIAARLGAEIVDINAVAIEGSAIARKTGKGLDVDPKKLARLLAKLLKSKKDLVIVGHLAPYVLKPAGISLVVVLRRSPYELESTLEKRGYSYSKVRENLASEILGVSLFDALKTFGRRKVVEFDTTGTTPEDTCDRIVSTLHKKTPRKLGIDWLSEVSQRDDMKRFFDY